MADTDFGKYKLIAELGQGGMADVFLAVQGGFSGSGFRKLTVVKRLRKNLAHEPEFVAMLVDEARIAARLNHPNVVQTNEVGEHQGQYFIAMEYLDGQSLHMIQFRSEQVRKQQGNTPFSRELQYVVLLDVLAGLHHAHELLDFDGKPLEIVHRDVTPHNVFVTYDGQVKVVDFGIAKAARRSSETRQGILKGKVRYMAPEQTLGKNVDRRADLFAVGVMLWEAAAGRRLFEDMEDLEVVQMLVGGDIPRSPRSVNPDVPPALDAICVKALAQKASDRYATAEEFRNELEQCLMDMGTLAPARRQLPAALDSLFKDKRQEIRQIIEKQLQALDESPGSSFSAVEISQSTGTLATRGAVAPDDDDDDDGEDAEDEAEEPEEEERRGPSVAALGAAVVVALVLVAGAVGLGLKATNKAAVAAPALAEMNLRINATPTTAMVKLDEGALEPVPFGKTVQKDGHQHRVHVEAPGYQSKDDLVVFGGDTILSFDLVREAAPVPSSAPAAASVAAPAASPVRHGGAVALGAGVTRPSGGAAGTASAAPSPSAEPPRPVEPTPAAVTPVTTAAVAVAPTVAPAPTSAPAVDVAGDFRKAVNRAIRGHTPDVQACFDRAKVSTPQLAGSVGVNASLTPAGTVADARVGTSSVRGQGSGATILERCLVERFRTWTFPAVPQGASSEISYVFRFE